MRKLFFVFSIAAILLQSSLSFAKDDIVGPVKLTLGYSDIWADHDRADDFLFAAAFKLNKYHLLTIGADRLSRAFVSGVLLTDNRLAIGDIYQLNKSLYWENSISSAGEHAYFLPQLSVQTVPHYILNNGSEISLGFKYSRYPGEDVKTITPGYLLPVTDYVLVGVFGSGSWTYHAIGSGYVYIQDKFARRQTLRFTLAGGQSIEGINLQGHFVSYGLNYKWHFARRWWIEPYVEVYRGNIRNQNTAGLFLEWCPL